MASYQRAVEGPIPISPQIIAGRAMTGLRDLAKHLYDVNHLECAELAFLKLIACADGETKTMAVDTLRLGEVCMELNKLDDAKKHFLNAKEVFERDQLAEVFEIELAETNDHLGMLCEMRGDFQKARHLRFSKPSMVVCSLVACGAIGTNVPLECIRCRCVFYCSMECAKIDNIRHSRYCRPEETLQTEEAEPAAANAEGESVPFQV